MAVVVPRYHDMKPTIAVAKKGKTPGKLWCPHGVAVDSATNHIYIAEGSQGGFSVDDRDVNFARVSIFSETGEYLTSYTHDDMEALWGIAIHGNSMYVTDNEVHAVFHMKIRDDSRLVVDKLGSRGSGIGHFNEPRQLSISTNGDVYIADSGNNRIQILDSSLHPIREVIHPSMHSPYDVQLTTEEMYILSPDSPCVHVFTLTGHKIRSLITRGRVGKGMQLMDPKFFCLDTKKDLIISDEEAQQIQVFSNEYYFPMSHDLSLAITRFSYNLAPRLSQFLRREVNKAFAEVTGEKENRGAGYGLEIPCVYRLYGPKVYIDKMKELLKDLRDSGLV